jgi:hypothetical protein
MFARTSSFELRVPASADQIPEREWRRRAAADRPDGNRISFLAAELLAGNDNALVIADGVEGVEPVLTFQGMKGQNGFADKDISIILTCLNPEKFAELNVIGQWLGILT